MLDAVAFVMLMRRPEEDNVADKDMVVGVETLLLLLLLLLDRLDPLLLTLAVPSS